MRAPIQRIRRFVRDRDVVSALRLIDELLERTPYSPKLLVLKAQCLLLSDSLGSLCEVESLLKQAIEADNEYVDAHVELAWYLLNVQDDARAAKQEFEYALKLLEGLSREVARGLLDCAEVLEPMRSSTDIEIGLQQQMSSWSKPKPRST
jgi:uncharacterized protein HemY